MCVAEMKEKINKSFSTQGIQHFDPVACDVVNPNFKIGSNNSHLMVVR